MTFINLHGIQHRPITTAVVMRAINELAAPVKFVEEFVGGVIEETCRTKVAKPFCHTVEYSIEAAVDSIPEPVKESVTKWVGSGIDYLEEKKRIPRDLTVETLHSLFSLISAVPMTGIIGTTLKTEAKKAALAPRVLKEAQIPHSWLGFEKAELKVGAYSVVQDAEGTYLSLRIDGLYGNGEIGVLRQLMQNIAQEASKHQATRLFLTTEIRNPKLEQVLSSRYGLQLLEENVRGKDNLYSLSIEKTSKISAPKAQTAPVNSAKK